jgi:hypothetical protein
MSELLGKIVVVTKMRKMPHSCLMRKYYDNMGGTVGRSNNGVCTAQGTMYSTERIAVSKERLWCCPLRRVGEGEKDG